MKERLVVNPHLRYRRAADHDMTIELFAPKPGSGLQSISIEHTTHANLFEIFTELADSRFDYLDPQLDLDEAERALLFDKAVIINASATIEKPLFECKLSDCDPYHGELDRNSLRVSQGFRFEPLDLSKFALFAVERCISPYSPSVWVRNPVTGIEVGFWLNDNESDLVSTLEAGSSLPHNIDELLLRRLITAGIIETQAGRDDSFDHWTRSVDNWRSEFAAEKYAVARNLIGPEQMRAVSRYYRSYVDQGFMPFGDEQVKSRYREFNEPFASFLHGQFTHLMSRIVGEEVKLSYVYSASYKGGSILDPHIDREQCEYSISFQVDYEPAAVDSVSPWAIYAEPLSRYYDGGFGTTSAISWEDIEANTDEKHSIYLASGDGLLYKGRELVHYRYALPEGHRSTSLFFHFVSKDFAGEL